MAGRAVTRYGCAGGDALWLRGRRRPGHLDKIRHEGRPPRLVGRAQPLPGFAMEVLVEEDVVAEVGVGLELLVAAKCRAAALGIAGKEADQPGAEVVGDFPEVAVVGATRGVWHLEAVAVEVVEALEAADEHKVDGEPDRAAPVGVAAVHVVVAFAGQITDAKGAVGG